MAKKAPRIIPIDQTFHVSIEVDGHVLAENLELKVVDIDIIRDANYPQDDIVFQGDTWISVKGSTVPVP